MISEEMMKKAAAEADQAISSPLQQTVNMNFPHRFKEKCAESSAKQTIL